MNLAEAFYFISFVQTRNFMENRIGHLEIENFKSIKKLQLDCKRVNIFIGKPNVGKSNILEAMSLLGADYNQNPEKFLSDFIRYETFSNLFYDNNIDAPVLVKSAPWETSGKYTGAVIRFTGNYFFMASLEKNLLLELALPEMNYRMNDILDILFDFPRNENSKATRPYLEIQEKGEILSERAIFGIEHIKKYNYQPITENTNKSLRFLNPPYGENLFTVIRYNNGLYEDIIPFFKEYGLQFVFREKDKIFEVQKNIHGRIYDYPYSSTADTLQRIIFYLAAIESNKDSVLIFEEPEAHAFPPYTKMLAHRIADDDANQYFLTTHSPYLLKTLIENVPLPDLNVCIVYYEEYQTKVHPLSEEHVRDILFKKEWDEDVFFNLDQLRNDGKQGSEILR